MTDNKVEDAMQAQLAELQMIRKALEHIAMSFGYIRRSDSLRR